MMKTVFDKLNRSGFHRFIKPALPFERMADTGYDLLGGLTLVSLSVGLVVLMRLLLAN